MRSPEHDFSLHWPELEDSCHSRYTLCELSANFLNFPHMRFGGWHQAELRQLLAQYVKCSSSSFFCLSPFWQSRTYDELEPMKPIAATSLSLAISLANVPRSGWQELCEICHSPLLGRELGDCCLGFLFEPKLYLALQWTQKEPKDNNS